MAISAAQPWDPRCPAGLGLGHEAVALREALVVSSFLVSGGSAGTPGRPAPGQPPSAKKGGQIWTSGSLSTIDEVHEQDGEAEEATTGWGWGWCSKRTPTVAPTPRSKQRPSPDMMHVHPVPSNDERVRESGGARANNEVTINVNSHIYSSDSGECFGGWRNTIMIGLGILVMLGCGIQNWLRRTWTPLQNDANGKTPRPGVRPLPEEHESFVPFDTSFMDTFFITWETVQKLLGSLPALMLMGSHLLGGARSVMSASKDRSR